MLKSARTIAGPGGGKTTRALEIQSMVLSKVESDPLRIGFVSFTRAARREAAQRAADKFNIPVATLEKEGWFRTLHSVAYRQLGICPGELLTGSKADNEWLRNVLDDEKAGFSTQAEDDDEMVCAGDASESGRILSLWDCARMRQEPLSVAYDRQVAAAGDRLLETLPSLAMCFRTISLYEVAKQREGRLDFTDLLLRFAGREWMHQESGGWREIAPQGEAPILRVWQLDEAQDTSYLTSLVMRRLLERAQYFYCYLDPMQEIYSFAGADGSIFAKWPVDREEELPVSYRCGQEILEYGYRLIAADPNLPRKRQEFRCHDGRRGTIEPSLPLADVLNRLEPGQDALVLARTNLLAQKAMKMLDDEGKPWLPTKGAGKWTAPARTATVKALVALQEGKAIDGEGWWRLTQAIPSKLAGDRLLLSGVKKFYADEENRQGEVPLTLSNLTSAGAEPKLVELIGAGRIVELLDAPLRKATESAGKYGIAALEKPTIRVGTIHSSKGQQADEVVLLNRINGPLINCLDNEQALAEEKRVWYTGCTRARNTLTIADLSGTPFLE